MTFVDPCRVVAAAGPFAGELPALVVEEPFAGPRNNRFGDELVGKPFVVAGVIEAEGKALAVVVDVDVRRPLPRHSRIEADLRRENANGDVTGRYDPAIEIIASRHIPDADGVGARDGRYFPLPRAHENPVEREAKAGPVAPDRFILFDDGERAQISLRRSYARRTA
jgi:hypothetical protein